MLDLLTLTKSMQYNNFTHVCLIASINIVVHSGWSNYLKFVSYVLFQCYENIKNASCNITNIFHKA